MTKTDRVSELFYKSKRRRKVITTPEAVPINVQVAGNAERLAALIIDMSIICGSVLLLYIMALFILIRSGFDNSALTLSLILFIIFLVRNFYFIHFELKWQGRTPGKKISGIRVINRDGGELSASAVFTRNFTREVEIFLPLSLLLQALGDSAWQALAMLAWALVMALLPLFNKDHLRIGDIIAGTQVISIPKQMLLGDLTAKRRAVYSFTPEQLSKYGAFELQVLEELLRKPVGFAGTEEMLGEVAVKICQKISWQDALRRSEVRAFLNDFYAAERAELEREQLFGRHKEDKYQKD